MNEWERRATDFILILHLITVIQIDKIYFCLGKRDTGRGSLYPIMGFGKIHNYFLLVHNSNVTQLQFEL